MHRSIALFTLLLGGCFYDEDAYQQRWDELEDADGDGFNRTEDCNDDAPDMYPGAQEIVGNRRDENCDGVDDCYVDKDFDGFGGDEVIAGQDIECDRSGESQNSDDCDDDDDDVNPAATEVEGDGIDQDCDSSTPP